MAVTTRLDLTDRQFGSWTVIKRVANSPGGNTMWLCLCECGTRKAVGSGNLVSGASTSCGCVRDALTAARNRRTKVTHGQRVRGPEGGDHRKKSPEYQAWVGMKTRCFNKNQPSWSGYGGRGITVAPEWVESFEDFYDYIGPRPGPRYSVDRIDNDGNYEPGNVRWATWSEQQLNRRPQSPRIDMAGRRFGRWTVVEFAWKGAHRITWWHCLCDCGVERAVDGNNLRSGASRSCGCSRRTGVTSRKKKGAQ